jgi:hypothetical protein
VGNGERFTLTASVNDSSTALRNVDVQATWFVPNNTSTVPLRESAPGVYTAQLTAPTEAGQYHLSVLATGTASHPFSRQDDRLLLVRSADISQNGTATAKGIDDDGNGRFEMLRVTVPIQVNRAASYVASIIIRAPDGSELSQERLEGDWNVGSETITVEFNGQDIMNSGAAGPYTVELMLVSQDTLHLALDEQPLVQTDAYRADQFEALLTEVYLPLVRR